MSDPRPPVPRNRPHVSTVQVLASALAAVTATVAASFLGVAGTVIGAAVASVLTVVGNALYSHSIQRGAQRWMPPKAPVPLPEPAAAHREPSSYKVMGAAATGVFVGVVLIVTIIELIAGKPLHDLLDGKSGSGTTVFGSHSGGKQHTPVPTETVTVTPSVVVVTPTVTLTANTATTTITPTITVTPTPTPTPTSSASSPEPPPSSTP